MFCPYCGKELPNPDAAFCPFCGSAMEEASEPEKEREPWEQERPVERSSSPVRRIRFDQSTEEDEDEKRNLLPIILITVLALVLVVLLLLLNDGIRNKILGRKSVVTDTEELEEQETEEIENEPEVVSQGEEAETEKEEEAEPAPEEPVQEVQAEEPAPAPAPQEEVREEEPETDSREGQLFPDSSSRVLSWQEIDSLNATQVQDAINEIFARRGYIFNDEKYLNYYKQFSWYHGTVSSENFSNDLFSDTELENVERLSKRRAELKGN